MNDAPAPETRLTPSSDIVAERIGDQVVMLDLQKDIYLRLNESGSFLWRAVEDGDRPSIAELAAQLAAATGIDEGRALADATAFAADLLQRHAAIAS